MVIAIEACGLGKRYRGRWALTGCNLSIPAGHVVGLVGPNGAGKSTLLNLAVGLLAPTTGDIEVLGRRPGSSAAQLAEVGFVAQGAPLYANLSVADHLTLGARLNPGWDARYARRRVEQLGLETGQPAAKLSGGQHAQLALTLAIAKRSRLLILDEPVASLDPLARREFLRHLTEAAAEYEMSVVLSSHLVSELSRVCDYLVVLSTAHVQVAGRIDDLLSAHRVITGPPGTPMPAAWHAVSSLDGELGRTVVAHADSNDQIPDHSDRTWTVSDVGLEDLALAYLSQGRTVDSEETTCSG